MAATNARHTRRRTRSNRVALCVLAGLALGFAAWLTWASGEFVTVTCSRGGMCTVVATNLFKHDAYAVQVAGSHVRVDHGGRAGVVIEVREPSGKVTYLPARRTSGGSDLEDAARILVEFAGGRRDAATVSIGPGFEFYAAHLVAVASVGLAIGLIVIALRGSRP